MTPTDICWLEGIHDYSSFCEFCAHNTECSGFINGVEEDEEEND